MPGPSGRTGGHDDVRWYRALTSLIRGAHSVQPSGLATLLNEAVRPLGLEITVYLADLEQRSLQPLAEPGKPAIDPVAIDGTLAGRAFRSVTTVPAADRPDRLWVPLLDGSERLGVLDVMLAETLDGADPAIRQRLDDVAGLTGHLIVAKTQYGDSLSQARHTQELSAGAAALWRLLPPLTFTSDVVAISAIVEPCYEVGGDAFDYAVDSNVANLAILDAVGHGQRAASTAAVALGAIRAARINGHGLYAMGRLVDEAMHAAFGDSRFATGVLAQLDCDTGLLRYVNAGHPAPVVVRGGRVVARLDQGRRVPLGLDQVSIDVAELTLEPDDRVLFYTDGFTESRIDDEELFGVDRLMELTERYTGSHQPAPEILRQMVHHMLRISPEPLRDDATVMLVHWTPPG